MYSSWNFLAVRNLNEISCVLKKKTQSRRRRRRRLYWPGKEEDIISHIPGHTWPALRTKLTATSRELKSLSPFQPCLPPPPFLHLQEIEELDR